MAKTPEERLKILQMLEEGKISAEEATTLLRALEGGRRAGSGVPWAAEGNRYLRIRVTDLDSNKNKVNVTIPIGLVSAGMRIAERFAPDFEGFDLQELEELLASGMTGKLIEVMDDDEGELVEIYVE